MELVMRVLVEADDEQIARWAKQDEVDVEEVEKGLREAAEETCRKAGRLLSTTFDFIEWEG